MSSQQVFFQRKVSTEPMTLEQAKVKWIQFCRRFTPRTQTNYRVILERFYRWLPESVVMITDVSPEHIRDFMDSIMASGVKNITFNGNLRILRSFFVFLRKFYCIENPVELFDDIDEEPSNARYLTQQEYQKIRAVVGPERERDRAVFLANTGLRVSEFCGLAANDISPDFSSLSIVGKGRKRRIVPLNKRCQELMRKYEGKINYHKGRPIEVRRIRYECRMLAERAGIPRFGPHSLRHHFTTELVLKNVSLPKVARLLGHASTRTTEQVYLHILPEDMRDVTECLIA